MPKRDARESKHNPKHSEVTKRATKQTPKQTPKRRTTALAPPKRRRAAIQLADAASWPVEHVFVPRYEPWRVSGCGSAAIARRRPDGQLVTSCFWISLIEGGLTITYGDDAIADDEFLDAIAEIQLTSPPLERSTDVGLLAQYVWGAFALSRSLGYKWPAKRIERYLKLVPPPCDDPAGFLDCFVAEDGMVSPALWDVIDTVQEAMDDVPKKLEVAIVTEAEFALADRDRAVEALRALDPEFINSDGDDDDGGGEEFFDYTRKYPKDHWSPLKLLGGPQIIGSVRVRRDGLLAAANTLSMACRLVNRLKDLLGDGIRLRRTRWVEPIDGFSGEQWEPEHGPKRIR
jgi:hypothetical protein